MPLQGNSFHFNKVYAFHQLPQACYPSQFFLVFINHFFVERIGKTQKVLRQPLYKRRGLGGATKR
jgi:hypothetical protein